jgi:hypothetical protein
MTMRSETVEQWMRGLYKPERFRDEPGFHADRYRKHRSDSGQEPVGYGSARDGARLRPAIGKSTLETSAGGLADRVPEQDPQRLRVCAERSQSRSGNSWSTPTPPTMRSSWNWGRSRLPDLRIPVEPFAVGKMSSCTLRSMQVRDGGPVARSKTVPPVCTYHFHLFELPSRSVTERTQDHSAVGDIAARLLSPSPARKRSSGVFCQSDSD